MTYATLAQVREEAKVPSTVTTDDAVLFNRVKSASARLDRIFHARRPVFMPYVESRNLRVDQMNINSLENTLLFSGHLLELTSVTVGATALTVNTTVQAWPPLDSPIHQLRLQDYGTHWYQYLVGDGTPLRIQIGGIWGFHRDYAHAWLSVDTLAAAIVSTSVTSFTVADVDGADGNGYSPRISQGNLIRVDSEWMEVVSTNTTTNTVSVRRGVNGSTAATHLISAAVEVWQVEEPIQRAVSRQAAFLYARRGTYESQNISDFGVVNFPSDILAEIRGILADYAYE